MSQIYELFQNPITWLRMANFILRFVYFFPDTIELLPASGSNIFLAQNKICSLSLKHENLNTLKKQISLQK